MSLTKAEVQQLAVGLATWPPGAEGWLLNLSSQERAFQAQHGMARLIVQLKPEASRLNPILRLALVRYPDLTDEGIEATRQAVAQYLQGCLADETFTPRDLAASAWAAPRALAVTLIRGLRKETEPHGSR